VRRTRSSRTIAVMLACSLSTHVVDVSAQSTGWFTWSFNLKGCKSLRIHGQEEKKIRFGLKGAEALSAALLTSQVTTLTLQSVDLGDDGVAALANAVSSKDSLLRSLFLWDTNFGSSGARHLGHALKSSSRLETLRLSGDHIGDDGAGALAGALANNRVLQHLLLWDVGISADGATALATGLIGSTVSELWLSHNYIGDLGARALSYALPRMRHLASLQLQSCGIANEGAGAIAEVLPRTPQLKALGLSKNQIGSQGVLKLATGVEEVTAPLQYVTHGPSSLDVASRPLHRRHTMPHVGLVLGIKIEHSVTHQVVASRP
jgi:Ran GTPase-activating protein (RanGAP) involved in mRNA processing and transport